MAYLKPIVHGSFSNDIPEKCMKCAHKVYSDGKQICGRPGNDSGKFNATLAYGCFKYPEKKNG